MAFPKSVFIREVGPREGLQTMATVIPTEKKLSLLDCLGRSGVKEIEITSMVRPDRVPQMADADDLIRRFVPASGVRYTALYLNRKGFERAAGLGRLALQGWLYTATSDTFLSKNANTSAAAVVADVEEWLRAFASAKVSFHGVMVSTAFGCAYEGKAAAERLAPVLRDLLGKLKSCGVMPAEISLADTVGLATPLSIQAAVRAVRSEVAHLSGPPARVSLHLHDTRGTGIANAYAGLLEGVDCFDASVGGVGGCPFTPGAAGNIATEDLAYLCEELGISTGISLPVYSQAARLLEEAVGHPLPGRYYRTK